MMSMKSVIRLSRHDLILYLSCAAFAADSIANYFVPVPLFVVSIPALTLLAFFAIRRPSLQMAVMAPILIIVSSFLINLARFGFNNENLSDTLFVLLAATYAGAALTGAPTRQAMSLMTAMFALLFVPAFLGINNSFGNEDALTSGSTDIEFLRSYKQGLYRIPHLAAYMLAFGAMWWFSLWERERKLRFAVISIMFMACCLYTGSRTPIFILLIGFMASFLEFSLKKLTLLFLVAMSLGLLVLNIDSILKLTEGTFLYQYPSAIKTALTDFDRLSRAIIWTSWLSAMREMNLIDYLIGHSFANSMEYNRIHLGTAIWFHNDFLSIVYSYGIPALITYTWITLLAISKLKDTHHNRARVMLAAFVLASAFVNGFYKYLPIVFLLILSYLHFSPGTAAIEDETR